MNCFNGLNYMRLIRSMCLCLRQATKEGLSNGKVTADDMDVQLASQGLSIREVANS